MERRKNILLIMTDQHRLSAAGCYGATPCQTPNIDRLAAEGVRFENAYTTCPLCSPARASVITGQYPHSHGVTTNLHELGCNRSELADAPDLLSRRLQAAGYQIGYNGKWHLGTDLERERITGLPNHSCVPSDVGFSGNDFPGHGGGGHHYKIYLEYLRSRGLTHQVKPWSEKTKRIFLAGELEGPIESTMAYFLTEQTIALLEQFRQSDKPFFMWHNYWGPHIPYYVTTEYLERYRKAEIPPWPNYSWASRAIPGPHQMKIHPHHELLAWEDWAGMLRYYYAYATMIDEQIGRLVDYLKTSGLYDDTVIIFTSDHGETLGSHGGLVDKGWHHFEETHRIPCIVSGLDYKQAVRKELVSLADIYPTIIDLASAPAGDAKRHGHSLLPLLSDSTDSPWREYVVTEFHGLGDAAFAQRTLVTRDGIKYGYNLCCQDELYDLRIDSHETRNLVNHPEYRTTLHNCREMLSDWMQVTGDKHQRTYHLCRWHEERDWHRFFTGPGIDFGGHISRSC
ncbi:MAG: sulfatase-like hydrolase/transferase [Bacillota bacterium]|nr:sulfatase-like hydrolase/transferase [Bacillota bacterium]